MVLWATPPLLTDDTETVPFNMWEFEQDFSVQGDGDLQTVGIIKRGFTPNLEVDLGAGFSRGPQQIFSNSPAVSIKWQFAGSQDKGQSLALGGTTVLRSQFIKNDYNLLLLYQNIFGSSAALVNLSYTWAGESSNHFAWGVAWVKQFADNYAFTTEITGNNIGTLLGSPSQSEALAGVRYYLGNYTLYSIGVGYSLQPAEERWRLAAGLLWDFH